jgi:hypothetical protein
MAVRAAALSTRFGHAPARGRLYRGGRALAAVAIVLSAISLPAMPTSAADCAPTDRIAVLGVGADLSIAAADGRRFVLAGVRAVDPDADPAEARDALSLDLEARLGAEAGVAVAGPPDRWGRMPAHIFPEADDHPGADVSPGADAERRHLQAEWVEAGIALAWPAPGRSDPCDDAIRAAEAKAQARRAGLHRPGSAVVIDAKAAPSSSSREGLAVLVRGRITEIVRRGSVLYVNFGRAYAGRISVSMRVRAGEAGAGDLAALEAHVGERVLIRGVLEPGAASPRLRLASPEAIEADAARAPAKGRRTTW